MKRGKLLLLSAVLILITGLAAACTGAVPAPAQPEAAPVENVEESPAQEAEEAAPAAEAEAPASAEVPAVMTLAEIEAMYGPAKASREYVIGGIVKTLVNEHWQQVKAGYEDAARDLGVKVEVIAADSEADLAQQLDFAQTLIGKGVDALSVSPLSVTNLDPALEQAAAAGIPIINVDDARITNVETVFLGADHYQMGVLAAQYMIEKLPAGSQVAMVEGQAGSNAGNARRDGFHTTIAGSGLELVASQPGEWDRVQALNAAQNILQTNPEVKGIYAANDTMALGVIEAMGGSSTEAGIIVVGTDAVPEAIEAVRSGKLDGTIAAFPYQLGYNGLSLAVRALEGQKLPKEVQAPMELITANNIEQYYPSEGAPASAEVPAVMTLAEIEAMYGPAKASREYVIGGIVKTLVNEHWQQVKAGYEDAARDLGVKVEVIAADSEADLAQQLDFAQTLIGKGVDALSVSPLSVTNLDPALEQAAAAGIPIINVDDARITNVETVFLGADHYQMGVLAAQYMIEKLPAGSQVAMVEGQAGSNAGNARRDGFHTTIAGSGLELVASQPGEWDRVQALNAAQNILQTNPEVKGIYAANDTMALGVIEAMGGSSTEAGIIVVGTDAVPEAIEAVRSGKLDGTIAAFPYQLGYNGLSLAVRALEGQKLPKEVQAPMELITANNIEQYYPSQ